MQLAAESAANSRLQNASPRLHWLDRQDLDMPRPLTPPPFPDTPGAWLVHYRSRAQKRDPSLTLVRIANELAVSTDTLRRWERGAARPREQDLDRLAGIWGLAGIEAEFLSRCI